MYPAFVDRLIRDAVDQRRRLSPREVAQVLEHVRGARFETKPCKPDRALVGQAFLGVELRGKVPSDLVHVAKRVLKERQWPMGTTVEQYLADLHQAIAHPLAQLYTYYQGIGPKGRACVGVFAPNHVTAPEAGTHLWVVYSARSGRILTGFAVNALYELKMLMEPSSSWHLVRQR